MAIDLTAMSNNRERAIALINDGGATKQSLMEALGINDKSLASVFAQLRLMGYYPIKNEDGTYRIGSAEAAPKEKKIAEPKSFEETWAAAQKREQRAATALTNAQKRYDADPSHKNDLRVQIATAELELASILLGELEQVSPD